MMVDVGVDITKFSDTDQKIKTGDIIQILFAGSIEPRKGGALLLSAMSSLKEKNNQFVCKIVGDGPDKSALEKRSKLLGLGENVVFMGRVNHDEMRRVFSEADVFVFPSLRDTSGAIVLEAMAMEIPTVCIDHQGASIMVAGNCGLKILPDSPEKMTDAFAAAIEGLMSDDETRSEMGAAARDRVTQEYDWSIRVKRTSEDYKELVC
jgi:glycosyltransferase involved in cell wall biosynthesis